MCMGIYVPLKKLFTLTKKTSSSFISLMCVVILSMVLKPYFKFNIFLKVVIQVQFEIWGFVDEIYISFYGL
jgi:hypothetical protein